MQTAWVGGVIYSPGSVYLYRTDDGGQNWTPVSLELPEDAENFELGIDRDQMKFVSATDGFLVLRMSGDSTETAVYVTNDGGDTWTLTPTLLPEAGESAIEKLLDILQTIREQQWPEDSFFGTTTCNIGVLAGGTRPNVIPDNARAELQIRLGIDIEHVKRVIEAASAGRAQLDYASAHNPVRLFSIEGFDQCVVRFTTDVPYLSNWGKPLLLGPGSILDAHTDHEFVEIAELRAGVDAYVHIAKSVIRAMSS